MASRSRHISVQWCKNKSGGLERPEMQSITWLLSPMNRMSAAGRVLRRSAAMGGPRASTRVASAAQTEMAACREGEGEADSGGVGGVGAVPLGDPAGGGGNGLGGSVGGGGCGYGECGGRGGGGVWAEGVQDLGKEGVESASSARVHVSAQEVWGGGRCHRWRWWARVGQSRNRWESVAGAVAQQWHMSWPRL